MDEVKLGNMIKISTSGEVSNISVTWVNDLLPHLQAQVGGYIENVGDGELVMILNEEGKLEGLPRNEKATALAKAKHMIKDTDYIAGDVLIAGHGGDEIRLFDREESEKIFDELKAGGFLT